MINYTEKTIKCIQLNNGQKITEQREILKNIQAFYSSPFSQKLNQPIEHQFDKFFQGKNINKLTPEESKVLEGKLNLSELNTALKQMKNDKCPGVDEFSSEFFKLFWDKLKHFILQTLNYAFDTGELSLSLRTCIINCLPKGKKPCEFLKNWKPISLLSLVYKMASTAIVNRLKKVLHKLVSETQTGFITGRFIGENTRIIYDIMHYLENNNLQGFLMLADFQKAFDSVSWVFCLICLNFSTLDKILKGG